MVKQRKTKEELEALTKERLLSYYKAERKRLYIHRSSCQCECCWEFYWDLYPKDYSKEKAEYEEHCDYVELIKSVLETKGHVERKHN
jgi:hypothetical protein